MRGNPVELPKCGLFIGNGVYPTAADYQTLALYAHKSWTTYSNTPQEMIERIIDDNQGNLAQVWGHARGSAPSVIAKWFYALDEIGVEVPQPNWETFEYTTKATAPLLQEHDDRFGAGLVRFVKMAKEREIYTTFIYTNAKPHWSHQLKDFGQYYQGYDFGERFTFRFEHQIADKINKSDVTLVEITDELMERVKAHVDEFHTNGWGNVAATSSNFFIDVEVAAGAEIPLIEDFAFRNLGAASALSRGLYGQFDLPMWGTHLAHEHYSWIPWKSKYKFPLLRAALYHKYMAGAKMIINESGNWYIEASLCEDSPKFEFPDNPLTPADVKWVSDKPPKFVPYIEGARKHYHKLNAESEYCTSYRKEISDFYDFVKANGTPEGQPQATIGIIKGNYDIGGFGHSPNSAIGGMHSLAVTDQQWLSGPPERGWNIIRDVFFPLKPVMGDYPNQYLPGSPWGQTDIVSFIKDEITPEYLIKNYKALIFSAWNSCSDKQYETLKAFVHQGGTLFASIPHFSKNVKRNYSHFGVEELVNGGDLSELCGVKVKGPGKWFYWAVAPRDNNELGFEFPRRFGIMGARMGDIQIVDPQATTLMVDDEQASPLVLKRKYGKGTVYLLNTWGYPGSYNTNEGPGARVSEQGMVGRIFQHIASQHRGQVYITDDGKTTGQACDYINYSYFPKSNDICLQNVDFDNPRSFYLHQEGSEPEKVTLAPNAFEMRKSTIKNPDTSGR